MTLNHARKTLPILDELQKMTGGDLSDFVTTTPDGELVFFMPVFYEDPRTGNVCVEMTEDGRIAGTAIEIGPLEDAWNDYMAGPPAKEEKPPPRQRQSVTRTQAQGAGAIVDMPDRLALPSRNQYENALSIIENPTAYIFPILPFVLPDLHVENGRLYLQDMDARAAKLIRYKNKRPEAVRQIDAPLLYALYSILLQETMDRITSPESITSMFNDRRYLYRSVTIYLPSFLKMLGHGHNSGKNVENAVFAKLKRFESFCGCMEEYGEKLVEGRKIRSRTSTITPSCSCRLRNSLKTGSCLHFPPRI